MTPERRSEIEALVDRMEASVKKREAAHAANKAAIEQLVHDCHALFVEHPCGERVLQFLELYFCGTPDPRAQLRRTAENAMKFTAKCEGNREVVDFLRKVARGAVKVSHAA